MTHFAWLKSSLCHSLGTIAACSLLVGLRSTPIAALPAPPPANSSHRIAIDAATCQLDSTIQRNRRLEVTVPQTCVDDRLGIAQIIDDARDRANAFARSAGNVPLEVQTINYEPIAGGVRIRADLGVNNPLLGFLDVRVFQDVMASVDNGLLSVEAGETRLVLDVPIFGGGNLEGIARSVVDQQLRILNGKRLSELAIETGLDRVMAERSGLSREAVNFIVSSVEEDIDIELTSSGANVTIEFR
jgi:hypothetical protein